LHAIDSHAHVFTATAPAVAGARYRPSYEATLGAWRRCWTEGGITHGVLVQPSFFGVDNAEMMAALAQAPDRLRGVAVVDPSLDDAGLALLDAGGARAVRLNLKGAPDYTVYASEGWRALYRRIHLLGWHVEVLVDAGRLPEIAPAFAETQVAVVFDHFGNPGPGEARIEATIGAAKGLARERPVWVKLSGPYRLGGADPEALAARWIEALGPANLVWGSDWPWTNHEGKNDYRRLRAALDDWVGPALAPAILWDNAARLYAFT
jgi:predicted TIM-barrel fold metal-dependent hydrolase